MSFKQVAKYLIPIYIIWIITHIILFISIIFSMALKAGVNGEPSLEFLTLFPLLLISHFLVIIIGLALWIWMIVDAAIRKYKTDSEKVVWIIVIVFANILGAVVYFYIHGKNPLKK